jgi:hypothetical protein
MSKPDAPESVEIDNRLDSTKYGYKYGYYLCISGDYVLNDK